MVISDELDELGYISYRLHLRAFYSMDKSEKAITNFQLNHFLHLILPFNFLLGLF